jgi:hypothetical protein
MPLSYYSFIPVSGCLGRVRSALLCPGAYDAVKTAAWALQITDWNRANTENIRIGLVFAVLAQWKFLYWIDKFDHIKANKLKLINNGR